VTRSDDTLLEPIGKTPDGIRIFQRVGTGFSLVIEGRPGGTRSPIGSTTFNSDPNDPTALPYLLIEASRSLGDGSADVCDDSIAMSGGVPAVNPPDFSTSQQVADAINDFACRFKDGGGARSGRGAAEACTSFPDGSYHLIFSNGATPSTIQFCGQITGPIAFPAGDTLVTARIRDLANHISSPAQIIIRVGP